MLDEHTIELYRILKKASSKANFSDYEAALREHEAERLSQCIASLQLPSAQAVNFIFFEPKTKDIVALHNETDEYIAALQALEKECRYCIYNQIDIGNLSIDDLLEHRKINLSSTQNVKRATERLQTARGSVGSGTYFQGTFPLLIFVKPALEVSNKTYAKEFNKKLDDFIAARSVKTVDVQSYFQSNEYTYVSQSTVDYVAADANKNLTAAIAKFTRSGTRRLTWSMFWRIFLLFIVLGVPTLVLSLNDVHFTDFSWYWWIVYVAFALAAGIMPLFVFSSMNPRLYQIKGKIEIRMFLAPFLVTCFVLAGVLIPVGIRNGVASIVFAVIHFVLYVVGTAVR